MRNQYPSNRLIKKIIDNSIINPSMNGFQIFVNNNLQQKTLRQVNFEFIGIKGNYTIFPKNIFNKLEDYFNKPNNKSLSSISFEPYELTSN